MRFHRPAYSAAGAAVQRRHLAGVEIFLIVSGKFRCLGFKQDIATASAVNRKLDSKGNHHFANAVVFPLGSQCWVSIMKTKKTCLFAILYNPRKFQRYNYHPDNNNWSIEHPDAWRLQAFKPSCVCIIKLCF